MKLRIQNFITKFCRNLPVISLCVLLIAVILSLFVSTNLSIIKEDIYENERLSQSQNYQFILEGIVSNIESSVASDNIDPFDDNQLKLVYSNNLSIYNYINDNVHIFLFFRDTLENNETELKVLIDDNTYVIIDAIGIDGERTKILIKPEEYNRTIDSLKGKASGYYYEAGKVINFQEFKDNFSYEYNNLLNTKVIIANWKYNNADFIEEINELIPTKYTDNNYVELDHTKFNFNIEVLPTYGFYTTENDPIISRKLSFVIIRDEANIINNINTSIQKIESIETIFQVVLTTIVLLNVLLGFFSSYLFKYIKSKEKL
jgi:hypothetical protein